MRVRVCVFSEDGGTSVERQRNMVLIWLVAHAAPLLAHALPGPFGQTEVGCVGVGAGLSEGVRGEGVRQGP